MNAESVYPQGPPEDELGSEPGPEAGPGRALAVAGLVLVACVLAMLPAAVGLGLIPLGGRQIAVVLGGAALVMGALKAFASAWALAARIWSEHPARLGNVHPD